MRPGGGKDKGSIYERKIGATLSNWLTRNERADLFSRNVLSGGKYTQDSRKGKPTGMPGDLIASHPMAFDFLSLFCVECKHHKDILLDQYLFEAKKSHLGRILLLLYKQAAEKDLFPLLIAKQNNRPSVVFTTSNIGTALIKSARHEIAYHVLHESSIFLTRLTELTLVDPDAFLLRVREVKELAYASKIPDYAS